MLVKIDKTLENRKDNLTRAAYYRLLAADLLPPDVHRALYLDGDVVCTGRFDELFALDLKGCPVGMCYAMRLACIEAYNRLGYPPQEGLFNSGVILFDFDAWRRENITRAMLDYLSLNYKRLLWHDNDLICAVLHGRILPLDFSYNMMYPQFYVFYWIKEEKLGYLASEHQNLLKEKWPACCAACERPRFIHFTCTKPWYRDCPSPFAAVWRYFYAASPWKGERLKWRTSPAKAAIRRLGRRALERLNLVAPSRAIPYPPEASASAQRVLDKLQAEDSSL